MPNTKVIARDAAYTRSAAGLSAMPVLSPDPAFLCQTATDWIFDAIVARGHASGALPADGATLPAGGLVNVGNNSPAAIPSGLRGAVTALCTLAGMADPTFAIDGNGRGGVNFNGVQDYLKVRKAGISDTLVCHPPTESFQDFLWIAWVKPAVLNYWSILGCGNFTNKLWGADSNAGGSVKESLSGKNFTGLAAGAWSQLAAHYAFNTGTGQIFVRTFVNGAEQNTGTAATPIATSTSTMAGWATTNMRCAIGYNGVDEGFEGVIARAERHFTKISGHEIDPAVLVARNWAANKGRIAGLP